MFNVYRKELDFAGQKLVLETGKVARQADGAVMATLGGTTVLCTVVGARKVKEGQDFFPLSVHYQEKNLRRRQDPGRLLQAGRAPDREGSADQSSDRPSDPPALSLRLL